MKKALDRINGDFYKGAPARGRSPPTRSLTMTKFQPNFIYSTRSICDYETIIIVRIAKRTEKTVTDTDGKRYGIKVWDGIEQIMPWGRFSMAPTISADRGIPA
jgi:hypothetical protein